MALRLVYAEDSYLVREGTVALLNQNPEVEVVSAVGDMPSLIQAVDIHRPDIVMTDIRMPPEDSLEGIVAARILRQKYPGLPVVVLSQHGDRHYAEELLKEGAAGIGYLLKDRLMDIEEVVKAFHEVKRGGTVLDPRIIESLARPRNTEPSSDTSSEIAFRQEGDFWSVGTAGKEFHVKDMKGLVYLKRLLERPQQEFHAMELLAHTQPSSKGARESSELASSRGDRGLAILDDTAKQAYRARLVDLELEVEEARQNGDIERAASYEEERQVLLEALGSALGLGGRDRSVGSTSERARVNVTRAIRSAIDRIRMHDEELGRFFDRSVKTGTFCVYEPAGLPVKFRF